MQNRLDLKLAAKQATQEFSALDIAKILEKPVIILSAPRSGSTLLFEQLAKHEPFWTIGGESHAIFRAFPNLRAENSQLDSMSLTADHADSKTCDAFRRCFLFLAKDNNGRRYLSLPPSQRPSTITLLEKTPRNALNIAFLKKLLPDARYIYLYRDPKQAVSSLIEAWSLGLKTGRFMTFRALPEWSLPGWCFLLPRGWRDLRGKSLQEIAAFQWVASNQAIMQGINDNPSLIWASIAYSTLIDNPADAMHDVTADLGIAMKLPPDIQPALPFSRTTVTPPQFDKWKRHIHEIEAVWPYLSDNKDKLEHFLKNKHLG